MCIHSSVGRNCVNNRDDVKIIQILLNLNTLVPMNRLVEDGVVGHKTIGTIEEFQRRVLHVVSPDGRIEPPQIMLQKLREGMPATWSEQKLSGIMLHARRADAAKYYQPLEMKMRETGINTPLRMAHFLAQIGHESGDLRYSEEIASGEAYEGRADLGNTEAGDGKRFKGRGLIQLTGRANYERYGRSRGRDFLQDHNITLLAADPITAVDVACWYWNEHNLNTLADRDDIMAITRAINGGYNGLEDRKRKLERAKFFLMR